MKNAVWAQVQGLTYAGIEALRPHLKIRDKYSPFGFKRAKNVEEPGWVKFMDEEGHFLVGLIPDVQNALQLIGCEPAQIFRTKSCPAPIELDMSRLTNTIVTPRGNPLRDDQMEFIRRWAEYRRGIVWASTGFGKTAIMAAVLKMAPPQTPTIVLINSIDLIDQTLNEFIKLGVDEKLLGSYNGTVKNANWITITTSDSLPGLIEFLPRVRLFLADECHYKIVSPSVVPYLRELVMATDRLAFSATPWKKSDPPHNWKLRGHFGVILGHAETKPLQEAGILSDATATFHLVGNGEIIEDCDFEMPYDEAYVRFIVENAAWHDQVAKLVKGMKGRTLLRVERKTHGMHLVDRIPNAIWISGDDKKTFRREVREKLQNAPEDVVVVATRIFNTGVDIYIHNMVNCAGMASDIATIQGFGRGLRLAPDKDHVDYHDFFHVKNKHLKRHAEERARTLKKEGHEIKLLDDLV